MIGLTDDGFEGAQHGGGLQFQCPGVEPRTHPPKIDFCETLSPQFNTAVVFATRVNPPNENRWITGPNHQVMDVTRPEGGRYAITGWWMDVRDKVEGEFKAERDKMRSRKED